MIEYGKKTTAILGLIFLDVAFHAMLNHAKTSAEAYTYLGVLAIIRILILISIFVLVWDTVPFRFGLVGILCKKMTPLAFTFPVSTLLSFAMALARGSLLSEGYKQASLWDYGGFQTLFYFDYLGCILFYLITFFTVFKLSKVKYYQAGDWIGKASANKR
mmetsp:Transcript_14387/g.17261  ORF Transcript_14387/g.17261 Transcript_14387/m.17261 type:complete len:160 (+) Transcript_14387:282-761(+)|eukprot:jgi/Bigna1/88115/estExt_fgenesh1_pg.C_280097